MRPSEKMILQWPATPCPHLGRRVVHEHGEGGEVGAAAVDVGEVAGVLPRLQVVGLTALSGPEAGATADGTPVIQAR